MEYIICEMKNFEYIFLKDFLYEAIFIPEGIKPPPKNIVDIPELQVYISNFGKSIHDIALVAESNKKLVGAVWCRIMKDYGNIDDKTPSLAIGIYKEYRKLGIGSEMMKKIITILTEKGYKKVSLSVQKNNYAVKLYKKLGFKIFKETEEEYIMIKSL